MTPDDRQWAIRNASRERYMKQSRSDRESAYATLVGGTHTFMCSRMQFNEKGRFQAPRPRTDPE